jgi:hypothetical protein
MKLTVEIDTATASPAALAALRTLLNEATAPALLADPLAGHPELPLGPGPMTHPPGIPVDGATAEPLDPTRRLLPWGDLPEPPPAPEGKRWVNRGEFGGRCIPTKDREVRYLDTNTGKWDKTDFFSYDATHIELIDAPASHYARSAAADLRAALD